MPRREIEHETETPTDRAGKTTKEIALQLDLSIKTVEHHREKLFSKLRVNSAVSLIFQACSTPCWTSEWACGCESARTEE